MRECDVLVTNVSGAPYVVEEIGGYEMAVDETINLLDHGYDWLSARRCCFESPQGALHQARVAELVTVQEVPRAEGT